MLILGFFSYAEVRKLLIQQEQSNMSDYLNQAIMSADNQIQIYNNLSEYISYNDTVAKILSYEYDSYYEMYEQYTKVLDPMLSSVKYFNDGVKQLTIYADNDTLVKHDATIVSMEDISDAVWYKQILRSDSRDINWLVRKGEKEVFSVRLMPTMQKLDATGILYVKVDYDKLFESFRDMGDSQYGVYVVNDQNDILFETTSYETDQEKSLKLSSILNQSDVCDTYTIVSADMMTGWKVWFYKPNQVIGNSVQPLIVVILIMTALCILFSVVVATVLSKVMVSDIEKLTKNMKAVEKGDMEIQVVSESADEVGNLIRGFGNMINQINQLINEVYKGKISQKESEMRALQAQINPHFLYNSLSLINWKALETEQMEISRLTLLLSTFYRTALNRGKNVLSIRDELRNMNSYLEIQLIMHDHAFRVECNVEEDIMECQTLNLILQPLVENAIDHGVDMNEEGTGLISIRGWSEGNKIYLTVTDNGVGMDEETAGSILTKESKGYGVCNVNERIMLCYGEAYHLTVESKLGEGTTITICIPQIYM